MFLGRPRIKVSLPQPLHHFVKQEAGRVGLSMSEYIRHLVMMKFQEQNRKTQDTNLSFSTNVPSELFNEHYEATQS